MTLFSAHIFRGVPVSLDLYPIKRRGAGGAKEPAGEDEGAVEILEVHPPRKGMFM